MRAARLAWLLTLACMSPAAAQTGVAAGLVRPTNAPQEPPTAAGAFAIEAMGGIAGTALGFGAVLLATDPDDCGEDLSCTLGNAAAAVLLGTAGAAAGTYGVGRLFRTEPSGWGAILGAVAGAAAAIGLDHLLTEEASIDLSDSARVVVFAVTQGTVTALGSRIGAALR